MKRNEAIELLEKFQLFLHNEGYTDSDIFSDRPTALDQFMGTKWAKENMSLFTKEEFDAEISMTSKLHNEAMAYNKAKGLVDIKNLCIGFAPSDSKGNAQFGNNEDTENQFPR